ncbi:STAS domain-containing protein [Halorhodospira neutriphila]|uniref:STAS domain-containing protein n=1 Tax=Halorhodospira neutriphila TaxID=168379 RepID=A0ABS1E4U4_9GAMM|nr:STAS domain-containing protein [Halorhodospira neutriphila]MBK1725983.1 hypothetical protein [Halorhodospira neutriphila]
MVHVSHEDGGDRLVLNVRGRLDLGLHEELQRACEEEEGAPWRFVVVDLREATYLDTSGLDMLLMLRKSASQRGGEVILRHCSYGVRKVLQITKFQHLFRIEDSPPSALLDEVFQPRHRQLHWG